MTSFAPASYDSWLVGIIRVVVHNLGPVKEGANISYNHWTISLLVAPDIESLRRGKFENSVRLDLRPEGPENGKLYISFLQYLLTRHAIQHFDFPAAAITVKRVKDLLRYRGRHRYRMTPNGGCQWWW